ncbi:MAG: creatininase family protein [Bacteroidales bacterium]|nr:creatininase family protein [Bacteroidales bacterium]
MRSYILSETNWKFVKEQDYQLAVLPWGATEAHNYHLPYGTDNFETDVLVHESARIAWEQHAKVVVLPTIPVGVNTGQADIKLTLNLHPGTQQSILKDIVESLFNHGIIKLLIVNGHGGNDFKQMIREVGRQFPDMFISTCNWFQSVDKGTIFENEGDHADEMETSLMMYTWPELVLPLDQAGNGTAKKFRIDELNERWAWTERKWSRTTSDTGIGNPKKATREKGEKYFKEVTSKLANLMIGLITTDLEDIYQ